mmetsp:Transcript_35306/g.79663  ORF Transcript_35306/g.79663 Transcript_35306/m.79663 type:complete len:463 (+) Transcript_35306:104-1492(+)|eukprot:CAMPEP_0172604250 /NCGR_PEP_ID=MMETSP1068-20121228/24494_1 /TAXON_ID=35684 /ORGANISM="Pseudopedinella elastica, Strain CCMP716" /LENGTH=462 /DNA_ID=CAMNT_0013406247 /DNA_START=18 /DNA_END=1409 /DNA_ORIENTATION=+
MGPKPKKKKAEKVVDPEVEKRENRRKEMIKEADKLQKSIQFEEQEAARMKLSHFQLHRNWAIDKNRIEELGGVIRVKEGQIETLKEQQSAEIMELKKKLKDYLLDLHEEVVNEQITGEQMNKQAQDMQREVLTGLRSDERGLKKTHKERELGKEDLNRKLKRAHDRASYEVRRDYERRLRDCKNQYDHDARTWRDLLDRQRKDAVALLEEKKLAHTARVMKEHEQALKAIREYYVDITHNNLEKIKELKAAVAAGRMTEEQDLLAIRRLARENKAMALPLRRANDEVYMLKEQLREHEAEKEELRNVTATLLAVEHESKSYDWEKEVLTQRLARAEHEVKELNEKYLEVTSGMDQKNGFERLLLERRIAATKAEIDAREAQMHHVLVDVGKVQSAAVRQITDRPNPLQAKREKVAALGAHFETLDETYVAMVAAAHAKLAEYGIAPNEMGFEVRGTLKDLAV